MTLEKAIATVAKEHRLTMRAADAYTAANSRLFRLFDDTPAPKYYPKTNAARRERRLRRTMSRRVKRYLLSQNVNWVTITWDALLKWLREHWMDVLKIFITLLALI